MRTYRKASWISEMTATADGRERLSKFLGGASIDGGHIIWKPDYLKGVGFPADFVDEHIDEHKSDRSSHTSTIYDSETGEPMESLKGVYGLPFLYAFATACAADTDDANRYYGRGSQARSLVAAIRATFGNALQA